MSGLAADSTGPNDLGIYSANAGASVTMPVPTNASEQPAQVSATAVETRKLPAIPPSRTLRARPSLAGGTAPSAATPSGRRQLDDGEIESIKRRLGPEGVAERRDELIRDKEAQVKTVIDEHDTAVREKFHLERFVTMVTGWNPALAKVDNSPVFMDYKRFNHNLFDLVPQHGESVAGPSRARGARGARSSLPARQTRRQAHEQSDIFIAPPAASVVVNDVKGKGKAIADAVAETVKGKGSMLPPPVPQGKGKKGRRQTLDPSALAQAEADEEGTTGNGKKRERASLPASVQTSAKKGPGRPRRSGVVETEDVAVETLEPEPPKKKRGRPPRLPTAEDAATPDIAESSVPPETAQTPVELPSLAHVPFDPPPERRWPRKIGSRKVVITDPPQEINTAPKFEGSLAAYLESYIHLEDSGPAPDIKLLETRAEREGFLYNRTNYLMNQGRLSRLLDEDPSVPASAKAVKQPHLVVRQQDHQEAMMSHMTQVRNAMMSEARAKPVVCRKLARMIMAYWEHIEGREEREKIKEEKEMKRKGKELVKALRKRWALAVKVVRAKLAAEQKAEQDRLGKEHLQSMLKRSTGLLEAQQDFDLDTDEDDDSDDGSDEDAEGDGEESLDAVADGDDESMHSGGTEEVSAAEDSQEEDAESDEDEDGNEASSDDEDDGAGLNGHSALLEMLADGSTETTVPFDDKDPKVEPTTVDESASAHLKSSTTAHELNGSVGLTNANGQTDLDDDAAEVKGCAMLAIQAASPPVADAPNGTAVREEMRSVGAGYAQASAAAEKPDSGPEATDITTVAVSPNGHIRSSPVNGHRDAIGDISANGGSPYEAHFAKDAPTLPIIRSRRARGVAKLLPEPKTEDPDVNDNDFTAPRNARDVDDEDHAMDVEMEEDEPEDGSQADSEDAGLLADADVPIEELLKRYGYDMPANVQQEANQAVDADENGPNTNSRPSSDVKLADQSLADHAIGEGHSPTLVIDGKRQRRVRQVWTPEDNPPRPAKKPKIEVVKAETQESDESDSSADSDPEEESEDEEEGEEEAKDTQDMAGLVEQDPNAPKIRPPFLLRGTLRPYQHAGLDWLAGLYANNMNGILADEMGLGKTIQTISLLAHLACDRGVWGQHLIIVPTSVILNWEMEFKKFLPGFKVLTYYGSQKERKEKRVGWLTEHSWQVCITSYQIVLADQHIFRRKSWSYMILDEAHNIKNFRSQRWQTLLGFKAQRRLLLTGTPLQNNLMELWSLLYFLMPQGVAEEATAVVGFANHKDFMEWFSNPMDKAIESGDVIDEDTLATIAKLHTLLRPFILRRLKSEVETQLPGKFEHVVYCKLSKRQRFLYDEFMSRASTREALTSGGYLGVMNTLMQLRKVCNHPDLFEVRPVRTSFAIERSVAGDFTPVDLLVRKRLLAQHDDEPPNFDIGLLDHEGMSGFTSRSIARLDATDLFPHIPPVLKKGKPPAVPKPPKRDTRTVEGWLKYRAWAEHEASVQRWRNLREANRLRCRRVPIYGSTLLDKLTSLCPKRFLPVDAARTRRDFTRDRVTEGVNREVYDSSPYPSSPLIMSLADRTSSTRDLVERFAIIPPNAVSRDLSRYALPDVDYGRFPAIQEEGFDTLHHAATKLQIAFPDASLLQYDCGKLQKLYDMLRDLKANGHRVLIFTQMTRVLDILEIFLSFNGHRYLRLDGSTKIEDRQVITERFNSDPRIFCFIASSRSGGVGINLTGADTVFFYDSDWNPSMDRQCMDRAHRIGQTREVHIYRFVSSHTVEENMLKKANQKRLLDRMVIQDGDFTTEFFGKVDWRDMIDSGESGQMGPAEKEGIEDVAVEEDPEAEDVAETAPRRGKEREFARMVAEVEDEEDVDAARIALGEGEMDVGDFDATGSAQAKGPAPKQVRLDSVRASSTPGPLQSASVPPDGEEPEEDGDEDEDDVGAVDDYMLKWVEEDWAFFSTYRA